MVNGFDYDIFISCCISNDINFENDFININNCKCLAFDGTIENAPVNSDSRITFIKKIFQK
jgi:hypothetical protein